MRVLVAINVLVWGGLTWMGAGLLRNVAAQHIDGFPSGGQLIYYLYIPVVLLLLSLIGLAVSRYTRFRRTALVLEIALLAYFVPFILPYTGGV